MKKSCLVTFGKGRATKKVVSEAQKVRCSLDNIQEGVRESDFEHTSQCNLLLVHMRMHVLRLRIVLGQ